MSVDEFLLEILVCPDTRQPLREASDEEVKGVQAQVLAGKLRDVSGAAVKDAPEGLLIREDGSLAYAVRDGIPDMIAEHGLPLSAAAAKR